MVMDIGHTTDGSSPSSSTAPVPISPSKYGNAKQSSDDKSATATGPSKQGFIDFEEDEELLLNDSVNEDSSSALSSSPLTNVSSSSDLINQRDHLLSSNDPILNGDLDSSVTIDDKKQQQQQQKQQKQHMQKKENIAIKQEQLRQKQQLYIQQKQQEQQKIQQKPIDKNSHLDDFVFIDIYDNMATEVAADNSVNIFSSKWVASIAYFTWLAATIVLIKEKRNVYVQFHALQSYIIGVTVTALQFIFVWSSVISILIWSIYALFVIFMIVQVNFHANAQITYKLPVIGSFCENLAVKRSLEYSILLKLVEKQQIAVKRKQQELQKSLSSQSLPISPASPSSPLISTNLTASPS